ncbi:uncharacterized protein LOC135491185 [Lineus longissimus]|uniref:uncharacterized protein LOC135491185 n=1 Tax=Lineus longissimus TaxID=88925 RepID=UPI002B4CD63B
MKYSVLLVLLLGVANTLSISSGHKRVRREESHSAITTTPASPTLGTFAGKCLVCPLGEPPCNSPVAQTIKDPYYTWHIYDHEAKAKDHTKPDAKDEDGCKKACVDQKGCFQATFVQSTSSCHLNGNFIHQDICQKGEKQENRVPEKSCVQEKVKCESKIAPIVAYVGHEESTPQQDMQECQNLAISDKNQHKDCETERCNAVKVTGKKCEILIDAKCTFGGNGNWSHLVIGMMEVTKGYIMKTDNSAQDGDQCAEKCRESDDAAVNYCSGGMMYVHDKCYYLSVKATSDLFVRWHKCPRYKSDDLTKKNSE